MKKKLIAPLVSVIATPVIVAPVVLNTTTCSFSTSEVYHETTKETAPKTPAEIKKYADENGNESMPSSEFESFDIIKYGKMIYDNLDSYFESLTKTIGLLMNQMLSPTIPTLEYTIGMGYSGAKIETVLDYSIIKLSNFKIYAKIPLAVLLEIINPRLNLFTNNSNIVNQLSQLSDFEIQNSIIDMTINIKDFQWMITNGTFRTLAPQFSVNMNSGGLNFSDILLKANVTLDEENLLNISTTLKSEAVMGFVLQIFSSSNMGEDISLPRYMEDINLSEITLSDGRVFLLSPYVLPDAYFGNYLRPYIENNGDVFGEHLLPATHNVLYTDTEHGETEHTTKSLWDNGITIPSYGVDNSNSLRINIANVDLYNSTVEGATAKQDLTIKYEFSVEKRDYIQNAEFKFDTNLFLIDLENNFDGKFRPTITIEDRIEEKYFYKWIIEINMENKKTIGGGSHELPKNIQNNFARCYGEYTYTLTNQKTKDVLVKVPYYIDFCTDTTKDSPYKVSGFELDSTDLSNKIKINKSKINFEESNVIFVEDFNKKSLASKISYFDDTLNSILIYTNLRKEVNDLNFVGDIIDDIEAKAYSNIGGTSPDAGAYVSFIFKFKSGVKKSGSLNENFQTYIYSDQSFYSSFLTKPEISTGQGSVVVNANGATNFEEWKIVFNSKNIADKLTMLGVGGLPNMWRNPGQTWDEVLKNIYVINPLQRVDDYIIFDIQFELIDGYVFVLNSANNIVSKTYDLPEAGKLQF